MDIKSYHIETRLQQLISSDQAFHYRIVPVEKQNGHITFKTDESDLSQLREELQVILGSQVQLLEDTTEHIDRYLTANYRKAEQKSGGSLHYTPDFLEKILITAKEIGSSDIHFEPYEENCRVRYRLDGKLIEQFHIPIREYPVIINKIKIRANLDISEKRLPQDGRITMTSDTDEFDIRVSSLPTLHGEKIVLRILSKDASRFELSGLGFTGRELKMFMENIKKPNGIILISGPTGSGKTTTLYATLKLLNDPRTNILTIEDPIEYTLEGVNQVQLREKIGLDFASAMRTFLRQDPDVIMVGEIRDVKTANMAIRAALTGHLVLSTIHTNSAWATVSRLVDMGVPSFLIASTLNVSVAQRLVRKLCPHCKEEAPVDKSIFPENFRVPENLTFHFRAVGCNTCYHTGYSGRKAVYEIVPITAALAQHIKNNTLDIETYLKENNINTLKSNAIQLVRDGITSVEEVYALLMD
ncbi:GspE/PulE family protein [Sinomicrobium weinanense]|uniref:Type II/IV secretion system protein n=1 Tax=Sinomicrobium weinanense TaxID=2842200 RepID=A0A926JRA2_9FLAO|nr:GspE/PulE family protein [Sinomicrobium weinanense]MBC9795843.1 type II/IV secretion system protein [Sinomicrobium weinanense]MBU3125363.1 GspE/PulE family protein [Sinomicrobium weinanense]